MKSPIVSRKRHELEIKDCSRKIDSLERELNRLRDNLITVNRGIREVLPRLIRLREPIQDKEFMTYRICVDIHRDAVERAFTHGSDSRMIQYFAELLREEVVRKMTQFNFARCERR